MKDMSATRGYGTRAPAKRTASASYKVRQLYPAQVKKAARSSFVSEWLDTRQDVAPVVLAEQVMQPEGHPHQQGDAQQGASKWGPSVLCPSVPSGVSYQASMATQKTASVVSCQSIIRGNPEHEFRQRRPTGNHGLDAGLSRGNIYRSQGRHHSENDPVTADGAADAARPVLFVGQAQVMTPMGAVPISFELDAVTLECGGRKIWRRRGAGCAANHARTAGDAP